MSSLRTGIGHDVHRLFLDWELRYPEHLGELLPDGRPRQPAGGDPPPDGLGVGVDLIGDVLQSLSGLADGVV